MRREGGAVIAYYHRVLAADVPAFEARGWRTVALDWSPSVGPVALMERDAKTAAKALNERQHRENCERGRGND